MSFASTLLHEAENYENYEEYITIIIKNLMLGLLRVLFWDPFVPFKLQKISILYFLTFVIAELCVIIIFCIVYDIIVHIRENTNCKYIMNQIDPWKLL